MRVVLLGGDLNAYAVAVSFHKAFGIKSTVFCRYSCGITATSSIIDVKVEPGLLEDEIGVSVLLGYVRGFGERPYLIPCGDWYVDFLDRNREKLSSEYEFLIPPHEVIETVTDKRKFYSLLDAAGLPYPETVVLSKENLSFSALLSIESYPAVLKPSSSVSYYAHPFPNMEKVYFPNTPKEALTIAERIFSSGYGADLILQRRIGTDTEPPIAQTLTLLSDTKGRVRRGVLGEVLIEESSIGARGNYAAILSRPIDALTCRIISLVESMHYTGIANIDILSDKNGAYILELNPRQGRSSDYLRAAGVSMASFLVDAINNKEMQTDLSSRACVWHAIPFGFLIRRISQECKNTVLQLKKHGRAICAFSYIPDRSTLRRRMYVRLHALRRMAALKTRRKKHERN